MEILLPIAILLLIALAVEFFLWPQVFERPPWGRRLALFLGWVVLPLLFVLLLIYGQADPTAFAIALIVVGMLWLVFSVPLSVTRQSLRRSCCLTAQVQPFSSH
jgi:hypothetical protein